MDQVNITDDNLYDVIFYWDVNKNEKGYKQYCAETLCNILGFTPSLSVRITYDAIQKGKTLIFTTRDINQATIVRDTLLALHMKCEIRILVL
jgi:hypothetical protein